MKALITGISGFVGQQLSRNLLEHGYQVWGCSRRVPYITISGCKIVNLNLSQEESILLLLEDIKPDVIFHLSGQSSVKSSWDKSEETFNSNLMDSIRLLNAVTKYSLKDKIRIVMAGSSEEYGPNTVLPITEDTETNPTNPYGISKLSVSRISQLYHGIYGLNILYARPFNHIGPGQSLGFVTSDFAKQIIDIEVGHINPIINVGDLSAKRDFTDVRDIVEAYRLLFERGNAGQVYNVCSGISSSIDEILNTLLSFSSKTINVIVDSNKLRPNEIKEYYGTYKKINNDVGWKPQIPLRKSLLDIYLYWKNKLNN